MINAMRPPAQRDIVAAVEHADGGAVVDLRRSDSIYATSHRLEDVEARLDDGRVIRLMLKHLGSRGMLAGAAAAKPAFLYDPRRALAMYRLLLADAGLGTARCYGTWSDGNEHWLLMEKVPGVELYQVGDLRLWQHAARWLGDAHRRFARAVIAPELDDLLLRYDAGFYRLWLQRALVNAGSAAAHRRLQAIAAHHDDVIERLLALPMTIVHGEFYASNVLVVDHGENVRVCPVDWEMAGRGPGLIDVAALSTGWSPAEQRLLAEAYRSTGNVADASDAEADLAACRLHLCLRWLGWSDRWEPPAEHAHDWLGEATQLAEQLEVA